MIQSEIEQQEQNISAAWKAYRTEEGLQQNPSYDLSNQSMLPRPSKEMKPIRRSVSSIALRQLAKQIPLSPIEAEQRNLHCQEQRTRPTSSQAPMDSDDISTKIMALEGNTPAIQKQHPSYDPASFRQTAFYNPAFGAAVQRLDSQIAQNKAGALAQELGIGNHPIQAAPIPRSRPKLAGKKVSFAETVQARVVVLGSDRAGIEREIQRKDAALPLSVQSREDVK